MARRRRAEEQTVPLGPLLVGFAHLSPVVRGSQTENIGQRFKSVFFLFDDLDFVLLGRLTLFGRPVSFDQLAQQRLAGSAARARPRTVADSLEATLPFFNGSDD